MFGMMVGRAGRMGIAGSGGGRGRPTLDLSFMNGAVDSRIAVTRAAGGATYFDNTGTLQMASVNTGRLDYETVRQALANSETVTTGGVNPVPTISTAISPPVAGNVFLYTRTDGANSNVGVKSIISIVPSVPLTVSAYVWIPSTSTVTAASVNLEGTGTAGSSGAANVALTNQWQRVQCTANAATGVANSSLVMRISPAGAQVYISGMQTEYGTIATAYQPSTGGVVTTAARGLLVEEARTNSIRNPRAEGASAPSTPPTQWGNIDGLSVAVNGLNTTVVGTGSENGIPYIDLRIAGTPSATSGSFIRFEGSTQIVAVNAQTWTSSFYTRVVAGDLSNIVFGSYLGPRDAGGASLPNSQVALSPVPTAATLGTQRKTHTFTLNDATTAFVLSAIYFTYTNGLAVDVTLRIGAPQLELGGFVTSPILPAAASPGATTRARDAAQITIDTWYNALASTMAVQFARTNTATGTNQPVFAVTDGAVTNFINYYNCNVANQFEHATYHGNTMPAVATTADTKMAAGWSQAGPWSQAQNGSVTASGSVAGWAFTPTLVKVGGDRAATSGNLYVKRLRCWPRQLSNAELIQVTT